jgi:hypothetical protein
VYSSAHAIVSHVSNFGLKNGKTGWKPGLVPENDPLKALYVDMQLKLKKQTKKAAVVDANLYSAILLMTTNLSVKSQINATFTTGFRENSIETIVGEDLSMFYRFRRIDGKLILLILANMKCYRNKTNKFFIFLIFSGTLTVISIIEDPNMFRSSSVLLYRQLNERGFFEKSILELVQEGVYVGQLKVKTSCSKEKIWPNSNEVISYAMETAAERLELKNIPTLHSGKVSHLTAVMRNTKDLVKAQEISLQSTGSRSRDVNVLQGYFKETTQGVFSDQGFLFSDIDKIDDGETYRLSVTRKSDDSSDLDLLKIVSLLDKKPTGEFEGRHRKKRALTFIPQFPYHPKVTSQFSKLDFPSVFETK